ncbi:hypothetical protein ABMY26_31405 [Azospirillum sp. HJ39]|uniref:hypothetical protein n=1 Tax=Azospirillum sp. HJ39 TaxID=3159496 RepID=UPI003557DB50
MNLRALTLAGSALVTYGAAWAATDPPPIDQLAGQFDRALDLLERGGPAVVGLELVLGIAFLAGLAAVVLVLTTVMQALPRAARPLADAYATMRGGATRREEKLRNENVALARELDAIRTQLVGLEHRDEEKSRIILALVDQLAALGVDVAALRAMAPRALADVEVDHASAA